MSAGAARPRWRHGWWSAARRCPSPNFGPRPAGAEVTLAVVHSISLPPGEYGGDAIEKFFTNRLDCASHPYYASLRDLRVSAHFVVRRDGALLQFVRSDDRAWHAGASSWRGRANCNDYSVGIELEGLEGGPFEDAQYAVLARLLAALARRHPIAEVVGHEHVAPGRKHDPGALFDWPRLAELMPARGPRLPFATGREARIGAARARIRQRAPHCAKRPRDSPRRHAGAHATGQGAIREAPDAAHYR